ncbi:DUF2304 domain-containing protein [Paenibacillus sp. ISL-20]|uniref:DUF2304 domain-containing protein n=1 Tax=Paenibacillus sp. ISL-20 TaxID=2819163 RepID=UPI001BE6DF89|nr:DUF2304 domain-containing protein [Paenibacillus sp. ISL-20]
MIPFKLQFFLLIVSLLLLAFFILKIRAYKLELKYTVLWIVIILISILLASFPYLLSFVSQMLSIETPTNTLFLFALIACLFILYSLTATISGYSLKIKELSQELGLLKNEMKRLRGRDENVE